MLVLQADTSVLLAEPGAGRPAPSPDTHPLPEQGFRVLGVPGSLFQVGELSRGQPQTELGTAPLECPSMGPTLPEN